ncbi:DUF1376 domain-containing protein [uncultured Sphingomonas sp.]|uniref:YdaU family protein n=1 Tax=uncultured Sphingomonas sp. TaxID=158754 RepID=UPI0025FC8580|nr:DUF1376 domain-containing protein [uncultured Sphingomonas sp.]
MAEFPALPLWTDAYLGDTTHLTTFEHGAYMLLLMIAWRSQGCFLPDDDALLARYTRTTPDKWRKLKPVLQPFFTVKEGGWHQARLQDEFRLLQSRRDQQVQAGRASAKAKSLKRLNRHTTSVDLSLQRDANEMATPTPTPTSVDKSTGADAPPMDPVKQVFDLGVELLTAAGKSPRDARGIIGKWRRDESDAWVLQALLDAKAQAITDPVPWVEARRKIGVPTPAMQDARKALRRQMIEDQRREDAERGLLRPQAIREDEA